MVNQAEREEKSMCIPLSLGVLMGTHWQDYRGRGRKPRRCPTILTRDHRHGDPPQSSQSAVALQPASGRQVWDWDVEERQEKTTGKDCGPTSMIGDITQSTMAQHIWWAKCELCPAVCVEGIIFGHKWAELVVLGLVPAVFFSCYQWITEVGCTKGTAAPGRMSQHLPPFLWSRPTAQIPSGHFSNMKTLSSLLKRKQTVSRCSSKDTKVQHLLVLVFFLFQCYPSAFILLWLTYYSMCLSVRWLFLMLTDINLPRTEEENR